MSNRIGSLSVSVSTLNERRNHFRVFAPVTLRLRPLGDDAAGQARDAVAPYEELVAAAARYRKDLNSSGRAFVDRLLSTIDALIGQVNAVSGAGDWAETSEVEANISVSGLGFLWPSSLELGSFAEVEFAFAGDGSAVPFRVNCDVVRSVQDDSGEWDLGLRFTEVPVATEQRLVRILYDMQRAVLRERSGQS